MRSEKGILELFSLVENEVNLLGREPLIFIAKLHKILECCATATLSCAFRGEIQFSLRCGLNGHKICQKELFLETLHKQKSKIVI